MSSNYVDVSEVIKALQKTTKNIDLKVNKAINEATPVAKRVLSKNTPYWDGTKYLDKSRGSYTKEHMKDHIVYSKARQGQAEVGFDDVVAWRVHFSEFGTIKQNPQNFIEKTIKELEQEVSNVIQQTLIKELRK